MTIREQIRNSAPVMVITYAITTAILSIVIFIGIEFNVELDHFTQDPVTVMDAPFYLGFFSHFGILFWCGTAILCFYTRIILRNTSTNSEHLKFMLYSGLITSLLLFDDLFLLHESVFPEFLNMNKGTVYVVYVNIILLYLLFFRNEILESEYVILIIASALIAVSQFVDMLPMPLPEDSFLEDAVKLFGIVTWFIYYARYCFQKTEAVFAEAEKSTSR
jgi:hypothetical protein